MLERPVSDPHALVTVGRASGRVFLGVISVDWALVCLQRSLLCFLCSLIGAAICRLYYLPLSNPSHTSCDCLAAPARLEGMAALRFVRDYLVPLRQEPCRQAVRYVCKREVHGWTLTYERANEGRGIAVVTRDGDGAAACNEQSPMIM